MSNKNIKNKLKKKIFIKKIIINLNYDFIELFLIIKYLNFRIKLKIIFSIKK